MLDAEAGLLSEDVGNSAGFGGFVEGVREGFEFVMVLCLDAGFF